MIAHHGVHKDPDAIAAGLLVPLAQDLGPFLGAKADLPGRVREILDGVFTLGKASMCGRHARQSLCRTRPRRARRGARWRLLDPHVRRDGRGYRATSFQEKRAASPPSR